MPAIYSCLYYPDYFIDCRSSRCLSLQLSDVYSCCCHYDLVGIVDYCDARYDEDQGEEWTVRVKINILLALIRYPLFNQVASTTFYSGLMRCR